jgi:Imidazolonepropionase and related amidohydrolases
VILTNCKIFTVTGKIIENGYIKIDKNTITDLGNMSSYSIDENAFDLAQSTVYPGFIDAHTHIGVDVDRQVKSLDTANAVDFTDTAFPLALRAGVTTVGIFPGSANAIGGTVLAAHTTGEIINPNVGMKYALGENPNVHTKPSGTNGRCFVHCHTAEDIAVAETFSDNVVIIHGIDGTSNSPTMVGPILNTPSKEELRNHSTALAAKLAKRGIEVAICSDHPELPSDYLRTYAGIAIGEGLSRMAALKAITINPAKMLGISESYGSIKQGKIADLVIFDKNDDIFTPCAKPKMVIVNGKIVHENN